MVGIVGVSLVTGVELIFGGDVCAGGIGCGLCCVVLWVSSVFGFCWFLHFFRIMVSVEM